MNIISAALSHEGVELTVPSCLEMKFGKKYSDFFTREEKCAFTAKVVGLVRKTSPSATSELEKQ